MTSSNENIFCVTGVLRYPALVQIMAWRWIGDKPLSEAMLTWFTDAYMSQWLPRSWTSLNGFSPFQITHKCVLTPWVFNKLHWHRIYPMKYIPCFDWLTTTNHKKQSTECIIPVICCELKWSQTRIICAGKCWSGSDKCYNLLKHIWKL